MGKKHDSQYANFGWLLAAVSCVPTTAKVAQKIVSKDNPDSFILGDALGANISGVITSAIITGIYITIIPLL